MRLFYGMILFPVAATIAETKPKAFFAKTQDTLVPLSSIPFVSEEGEFHILAYGNVSSDPIEFKSHENYFYTNQTSTPGYLGVYDDFLSFSPFVGRKKVLLDLEKKVINASFSSCHYINNIYWIHGYIYENMTDCFKIDIYFLPYNRATKTPEDGSYIVRWEGTHQPISSNFPLVFAVEIDKFLFPLSGQINPHFNQKISMFSYSDLEKVPVEFDMQDNHAITKHITTPGYAGFCRGFFVFGPNVKKEPFILNANGKIMNHTFYSCMGLNDTLRGISHNRRPTKGCVQVDVYLVPYNQTQKT